MLTNGTASVALKDYAGSGKQVSVYAVDYSGSRSAAVKLDNPYYKAPTVLQAPTATPSAQSSSEQTAMVAFAVFCTNVFAELGSANTGTAKTSLPSLKARLPRMVRARCWMRRRKPLTASSFTRSQPLPAMFFI